MYRYLVQIAAVLMAFSAPGASWAQGVKWEIEGHAGGALSSAMGGGTASIPAGGPTFTTVSGRTTQAVSSWYYGDGAALVNAAADDSGFVLLFADRILPLDALLNDPLAQRQDGWSLGGRVAYNFTPRLAAEFNFDYSATPLLFTDSALDGLADTSDSFEGLFSALFYGIEPDVSSALTLRDGEGTQLSATGTLNINILTRGQFIPYVAVGGGVLSNRGSFPVATIDGRYAINYRDMPLVDESDSVTLTHSFDDTAFVGVFGGGVKVFVSARSGLRFDARVHLAKTTVETLLSADPSTTALYPATVLPTSSDPGLQFSSTGSPRYPSSLSGPSVDEFQALSVTRWRPQVLLSVGYFWQF